MEEEMKSQEELNCYTVVTREDHMKVLPSQWTYAYKTNELGELVRRKARFVANGSSQVEGRDYDCSRAPVVRRETLMVGLSIAAAKEWKIAQLDVTTAFLYAELRTPVYVRQPKGFESPNVHNGVLRLNKALYGLRNAGREWYLTFTAFLSSIGLVQSGIDQCMYKSKKCSCYLFIYVDDVVITGDDDNEIERILTAVRKQYKIKDGEARHILGIAITRSDNTVELAQTAYIDEIMSEADVPPSHLRDNPLPIDARIEEAQDDEPDADTTKYATILGKLQYLASATRPDIAYTVARLAQFKKPKRTHEVALHHLLGYVQRTREFKLRLGGNELAKELESGNVSVTAYADAGFGTTADGVAVGGQLIQVGGSTVLWSSRKQKRAATSTCEAELYSVHEALLDLLAISNLLKDMDVSTHATKLLCDNKSTVYLINNAKYARGSRHLGQNALTIRDYITNGGVELQHIPARYMKADFLTKETRSAKLQEMVTGLGLNGPKTYYTRYD